MGSSQCHQHHERKGEIQQPAVRLPSLPSPPSASASQGQGHPSKCNGVTSLCVGTLMAVPTPMTHLSKIMGLWLHGPQSQPRVPCAQVVYNHVTPTGISALAIHAHKALLSRGLPAGSCHPQAWLSCRSAPTTSCEQVSRTL